MQFVDTHCHIHQSRYELDADEVIKGAIKAGVSKLITIGTDIKDCRSALDFAEKREGVFAGLGVHPHEATAELGQINKLESIIKSSSRGKVVAIGEIGLDYSYNHSPKKDQIAALDYQLELAKKLDLPVIFHVREAFEDFFSIFDRHPGVSGVVHSFSAGRVELEQILSRSLSVGLNGIMTFTSRVEQIDAARRAPLSRIVLETDSPFLTPVPNRGKVNRPEFVVDVAKHLSKLREVSLDELSMQTTKNAEKIFNI